MLPKRLQNAIFYHLFITKAALANMMERFGCVFLKALEGLFIHGMEQNEENTASLVSEDQFREAVSQHFLRDVDETTRTGPKLQMINEETPQFFNTTRRFIRGNPNLREPLVAAWFRTCQHFTNISEHAVP